MIFSPNFREPEVGVRHKQENTKAVLNKRDIGVGTLYITESQVSWNGPENFAIGYKNISIHAISKDQNIYPSECLFLIIENASDLPGMENQNQRREENGDSDNESENDTNELLFIPEDLTSLKTMYDILGECQALHPDSLSETTDEDEAFEDMEEGEEVDMEAGGDGQENVQNMSNLTLEDYANGYEGGDNKQEMDEDQFEDAD